MTVDDPYATQNDIQQNLTGGPRSSALQFLTANAAGWHVNGLHGFRHESHERAVAASAGRRQYALENRDRGPRRTLVPGNVAANGLSGTPAQQTAGALWYATATITDNYYNPVGNAATGSVWFQTSDPLMWTARRIRS